jgi:hypothetical protein
MNEVLQLLSHDTAEFEGFLWAIVNPKPTGVVDQSKALQGPPSACARSRGGSIK